jgi:hypothetical protein
MAAIKLQGHYDLCEVGDEAEERVFVTESVFYVRYMLRLKKKLSFENITQHSKIRWQHADKCN